MVTAFLFIMPLNKEQKKKLQAKISDFDLEQEKIAEAASVFAEKEDCWVIDVPD